MQPCGTHQRSSSVHSSSAGKLDNQRCKDPQLRDPQKLSEKWRIRCASIRLDEHGCRCCISLSIIFSAIFQDVFRFLLLSARLSMNAKMAWAIWMVQNGRSPNPDKPWQIRHHTPLQLHLRLKDMAIWPPNLEKCSGEPSLNPNLSQSGGSLWTQFEIPHHWFQKFYSNF